METIKYVYSQVCVSVYAWIACVCLKYNILHAQCIGFLFMFFLQQIKNEDKQSTIMIKVHL